MSGPEFFQTGMGRQYYERTLPALIKAVNTVAEELKRANELATKTEVEAMNRLSKSFDIALRKGQDEFAHFRVNVDRSGEIEIEPDPEDFFNADIKEGETAQREQRTLLVHQPGGNYVLLDTAGRTFDDVGEALAWYRENYASGNAKILGNGKFDFWVAEDEDEDEDFEGASRGS